MQPHTQRADLALLSRDRARLGGRDEAMPGELAPGVAETRRTRDPEHGLQVAQPAGALLDVRLEVVRGVVIAQMSLLLLERLGRVERTHVERRVEALHELTVQATRAGDEAALEEARAHGDV